MIPMIGTMIGTYIIAKMLWIIGIKDEETKASIVTKTFCVIVILVSCWGIIQLFTSSSSISSGLGGY